MIGNTIKIYSGIIIILCSFQSFALDVIHITVKTSEKAAAAIGYAVEGKKLGGMGKQYIGTGAKNKTYVFGYRKNAFTGNDIYCGTRVLNKDTTVTLVVNGDKCESVVTD